MKQYIFYTLFSVCLVALSLTSETSPAHARVTVYGNQADNSAQTTRQVTGQQATGQQVTGHQVTDNATQPSASPVDGSASGQPGEQVNGQVSAQVGGQGSDQGSVQGSGQVSSQANTQTWGEQAGAQAEGQAGQQHPFGPSHQGRNAVITITPSTALKSSTNQTLDGEEEENSVTQWSSNATKAIVRYEEPEEPKAPTGAPQLRPLQ